MVIAIILWETLAVMNS